MEAPLLATQPSHSQVALSPSAGRVDVAHVSTSPDVHGFQRLVDTTDASTTPGAFLPERASSTGVYAGLPSHVEAASVALMAPQQQTQWQQPQLSQQQLLVPSPQPQVSPQPQQQQQQLQQPPLSVPSGNSMQQVPQLSAVDLTAVYSQMMLHFSMLSTKLELVSRKVDMLAERLPPQGAQYAHQQPQQQHQQYQQQQQHPSPPLRDPIFLPAGLPGMPYPAPGAPVAAYPYLQQPPAPHLQHPPQPQHPAPQLAQQSSPAPPGRPANISPFVEGSSIPTRDKTAMCPMCFQYFEQPHIVSHIAVVHPEQQPQVKLTVLFSNVLMLT